MIIFVGSPNRSRRSEAFTQLFRVSTFPLLDRSLTPLTLTQFVHVVFILGAHLYSKPSTSVKYRTLALLFSWRFVPLLATPYYFFFLSLSGIKRCVESTSLMIAAALGRNA
jgi:hypothetical protein